MSNEPSCVCESTSGTHHTTHHSPPMSRRALSRVMSHGVPDHHAPPSHTLLSAPQPRATKPLSHQATESPRYEWQPAQPRLVAVIAKAAEDAAGTKATGDCTGTREIRRSQYVHTACIARAVQGELTSSGQPAQLMTICKSVATIISSDLQHDSVRHDGHRKDRRAEPHHSHESAHWQMLSYSR